MLKLNYNNSFKRHLIQLLTLLFRKKELKRLRVNYQLFLKTLDYSLKQYKGKNVDKFLECYLLLGNKLLIDIQSAKILCECGLYGSSHTILTVIQRTIRMVGALHLRDDLIVEYLNEEKNSDSDREFMIKFSEGSLQKILDERFGKFKRGEYANLDKSLHGSSVGSKIFYARIRHNSDGTKGGDLTYDAFFEDEKSTAIINIICSAIIDMCGVFIERYQKEKDIVCLKNEYDKLLKAELKNLIKSQIKSDLPNFEKPE